MTTGPRLAVVGAGRWGARYLSTLAGLSSVGQLLACDIDPAARARVQAVAPGTTCVSSLDELSTLGVEAAIIATPSSTHASLALRCIEMGLHILVEKPLATEPQAATEVIAAAARSSRLLLPGHITLHDPGVQRLINMVKAGDIGQPLHFHAERSSVGGLHRTESTLWALGPHDLATFFSIVPEAERSKEIRAVHVETCSVQTAVDIAFKNGSRATFRWSRTEQAIVRKVRVIGTTGELVLDEPSGTLHLRGAHQPTIQPPRQAPLELQCLHFLECLQNGVKPRPSPGLALAVVGLLHRIQATIYQKRETEPMLQTEAAP